MAPVTAQKLNTCTGDELWEYDLPTDVDEDIVDFMSTIGTLVKPIPSKPLYRLETDELVLLAVGGDGRVRLRIKAGADATGIKRRIDRHLEEYADR